MDRAATAATATGVTARWLRSAHSAPAEIFDGRYFSTTVAWVRAWEEVRTERVLDHRHLALEGGPIAELVPYFLIDHSPQWLSFEDDSGVHGVWTGPVAYSSTLYGEYGGAGGSCPEYIARAVDLGLEQAGRWGAEALVFANLTPAEVPSWSAVRPAGFPVLLDRAYAAPLGGSEDAFLSAMRGKVRRELVRQWRRAGDAGVRLRVLPGREMLPRLDEFTELAGAASSKHGVNIYGVEMFRNLVSVPGAVLLVAEYRGRMAGAFYCFLHRGRFSMSSGGLDYGVLRELNTYGFLMYESLRYAASHGADVVDPGRGNFAYKERHGFRGTDLWSLVFLTEPRPGLVAKLARMSIGVSEHMVRNGRADDG
jgi:hypothetical protein